MTEENLSRARFIRLSAALGMGTASASMLAACGGGESGSSGGDAASPPGEEPAPAPSEETAEELARLLRGRLCHVNLIPLNPVDVLPYDRPDPEQTDRFAAILRDHGIPATVRYSRGLDIAAACGQLRSREIEESGSREVG